jgi:hypothetical protein
VTLKAIVAWATNQRKRAIAPTAAPIHFYV